MAGKHNDNVLVENQELIGGVLLGAALGALTLYFTSNHNRTVKSDATQLFNNVSDKASFFANKVVKQAGHTTEDLLRFYNKSRRKGPEINWAIGGIAGGILGVSAYLLLSENGKCVRNNLVNQFECLSNRTCDLASCLEDKVHETSDHLAPWVKTAQILLNNFQDAKESAKESLASGINLEKVVDLAMMGLKFYNSLKK